SKRNPEKSGQIREGMHEALADKQKQRLLCLYKDAIDICDEAIKVLTKRGLKPHKILYVLIFGVDAVLRKRIGRRIRRAYEDIELLWEFAKMVDAKISWDEISNAIGYFNRKLKAKSDVASLFR